MKPAPISAETRAAILDAAWTLMAEKQRLDLAQSEIAAAAGVSRQTVYLAFGSRAGLLTAMVRNRDTRSDHVARMEEIAAGTGNAPETFLSFIDVWMDYLPLIYPVAILLDAAALTDPEAAAAWDDRMKGALLRGMKRILGRLDRAGHLRPGWAPRNAAELSWSLVHPASWRLLVVGCGWSAASFRRSRLALIRATVLCTDAGNANGASPSQG